MKVKAILASIVIAVLFAVAVLLPAWMFFSDCATKIEAAGGFGDAAGFLWQGWIFIVVIVVMLDVLVIVEFVTKVH